MAAVQWKRCHARAKCSVAVHLFGVFIVRCSKISPFSGELCPLFFSPSTALWQWPACDSWPCPFYRFAVFPLWFYELPSRLRLLLLFRIWPWHTPQGLFGYSFAKTSVYFHNRRSLKSLAIRFVAASAVRSACDSDRLAGLVQCPFGMAWRFVIVLTVDEFRHHA